MAFSPLLGLSACCVCPPGVEELDALGFRSPEQTFRTFQLAVRADSPSVEYRCLSVGFRARHDLSQLAWREFRDEWYDENPFLRHGIAKAEVVSVDHPAEGLAILVAEAYGRSFELELVREAFYQLYAGERLLADDLLPSQRKFHDWYVVVEPDDDSDGRVLVRAAWDVDAAEALEPPTEARIGLEWKIDGIRQVEKDAAAPEQPTPQS